MSKEFRKGSVAFWAWSCSIGVHVVVLGVLGLSKIPGGNVEESVREVPSAKVVEVSRFVRNEPVAPKPKIKESSPGDEKRVERPVIAKEIFGAVRSKSESAEVVRPMIPAPDVSGPEKNAEAGAGTEFYGTWTSERKICYVVDCSGSMKGIFGGVKRKLKDSIERLKPDQYFCLIFFGGDKLIEFSDARLVRASERAKGEAYDFIDNVNAAGGTNAMSAIQRAMKVRDDAGRSPSVIYFLTDGFELSSDDARGFEMEINELRQRFAPKTIINAIGFWPESGDKILLESIATQSGGEFVSVTNTN